MSTANPEDSWRFSVTKLGNLESNDQFWLQSADAQLLTHIINGTPGESDLNGHQRVVTLVRHGLQIA